MDQSSLKRLSKFLSRILRHQPEAIGLSLDANGWADISQLLEKAAQHQHPMDIDILKHIVATNPKQRFSLDAAKSRIRANQGHSIAVDLSLLPQQPPALLYHGTGISNAAAIAEQGILKQQRQHVHLSSDMATATQVGSRHGKPYIFTVTAGSMHRDGFLFYCSENGVWLTDNVPPQYLESMESAGKAAHT